jgi:putative copper export protein
LTPARPSVFAGLAIGVPVVLLIVWSLGGLTPFAEGGLPVVPRFTLWSLPVDVFIRNVAAAFTVGFALVGGVLARRPDPTLGRIASLSALVWLVALVLQVFLSVSEILALPLSRSFDPAIVWSLLTQTTLGRVLLAQIVIVFFVALLAWVVLGKLTGWLIFLAAATAAWLPSFTGHSGIAHGHAVATVSLAFHMVAASVWVGGLAAIVVLLAHATRTTKPAPAAETPQPPSTTDPAPTLNRFNIVALISVILLAESGILNASLRLDGVAGLLTTPYGTLLLAKVSVLIVLIAFGWQQRKLIAARIARTARPRPSLITRFTALEFTWMGVVLGISVALARTAPPVPGALLDNATVASLVVLAVLLPIATASVVGRGVRLPRWLSGYPEVVAVVLLVCLVVAAQLGRVGYGRFGLGVEWVSLLVIVVLVVVGGAFALVVRARQSRVAVAMVMLALPAIVWWFGQSQFEVTDTFSWLLLGVSELALLWLFLSGGAGGGGAETAASDAAPNSAGGGATAAVAPKRLNVRDIVTLDLPLVIVLTLCTVATIIEFTRALDGVSVAWVYTFQWPIIGVFAYVIWDRYRQGGRTLAPFQRLARPRPNFISKRAAKPAPYTPEEERAWLDYLDELNSSKPPETFAGSRHRKANPPTHGKS